MLCLTDARFRGNAIELKYEGRIGEPVVLTVTADFVAAEKGQPSRALCLFDIQTFVIEHATELKTKAAECKAQGLKSRILKSS
jgi:hypothetical protein